jgi:hypothetical protein
MKHHEMVHTNRMGQPHLTEREILILQSYLLSPGFHSIRVPTIAQGRALLSTFGSSLRFFSRLALLSDSTNGEIEGYTDLTAELEAVHVSEQGNLEQYMLHCFDYDFLAIEGTRDLLASEWFGRFEQLLIDYNLIKTVPILMIFSSR